MDTARGRQCPFYCCRSGAGYEGRKTGQVCITCNQVMPLKSLRQLRLASSQPGQTTATLRSTSSISQSAMSSYVKSIFRSAQSRKVFLKASGNGNSGSEYLTEGESRRVARYG
jgi:hypothetical protein